ncbi:signal-regulatory protein beta-2 isoform X2 [Anolis carolinensis]|uniref:signal-regulatory protein beta-2 isoform X2 n=1 Tax=Anolis carolinensis TaxID=28377 RepID=UPI002F2B20E1
MSLAHLLSPVLCLFQLFILLLQLFAVESQITEIIQVPESLSVFAGEEFTLDCLLIGRGLVVQGPGGVRWYKGLDRTQPAIYSQKQSSLRVTRLFPESPTDFSITISNAQSEDAGTYYCVKYKKIFNIEAEEMVGKGTVVSVIDVRGQTQEIIQVPETLSVSTGGELTLHCILMGSGSPGGVRWYKGPDRTQPAIYTQKDASPRVTRLVPESPTDFSITISNVRPEDAGTYYCVKYKKTSGTEVEETAGKGTMVSVIVPPNVRVETYPPPPVHLNGMVTLICNVEHFYPNVINVAWFMNNKSKMGTDEPMIKNSVGLFSLKNSLVVRATEEKNMSIFTCQVRHNFQPPINQTATLIIRPYTKEDCLLYSYPTGLWVGLFLSKILTGFFLLCLFLRKEHSKTTPGCRPGSARESGASKPSA